MDTLDTVQTFRAEEASPSAIYAGDGTPFSAYRRAHNADPVYRRKLAGALRFVQEVWGGERPQYQLREVLTGERHLTVFRETLTTSDFSNLFGDILDRQLLAQYASIQPSWQQYCKRATVNDFRTVKRFTLDGLRAPLSDLPEGDAYHAGTLADGVYSYAVKKYGRTVPLSWESIINDDLSALSKIPELFATAAVNTVEKFVTDLLFTSAGFRTNIFSSANKNLVSTSFGATATNPPLSLSGLNDAMLVLMSQIDATDSAPIAVRGAVLVVPPQLAITAQNIVTNITSLRIGKGGGSATNEMVGYANAPEWLRNLKVVVNYYIPLVDTTRGMYTWLLFADPATSRQAVEVGFLRGHEAPEIFRKLPNSQRIGGGVDPMDGSYENDSVGYKLRYVLGGTTVDPKGMVVSNGAGS